MTDEVKAALKALASLDTDQQDIALALLGHRELLRESTRKALDLVEQTGPDDSVCDLILAHREFLAPRKRGRPKGSKAALKETK